MFCKKDCSKEFKNLDLEVKKVREFKTKFKNEVKQNNYLENSSTQYKRLLKLIDKNIKNTEAIINSLYPATAIIISMLSLIIKDLLCNNTENILNLFLASIASFICIGSAIVWCSKISNVKNLDDYYLQKIALEELIEEADKRIIL